MALGGEATAKRAGELVPGIEPTGAGIGECVAISWRDKYDCIRIAVKLWIVDNGKIGESAAHGTARTPQRRIDLMNEGKGVGIDAGTGSLDRSVQEANCVTAG